jgi:hypothetical protein
MKRRDIARDAEGLLVIQNVELVDYVIHDERCHIRRLQRGRTEKRDVSFTPSAASARRRQRGTHRPAGPIASSIFSHDSTRVIDLLSKCRQCRSTLRTKIVTPSDQLRFEIDALSQWRSPAAPRQTARLFDPKTRYTNFPRLPAYAGLLCDVERSGRRHITYRSSTYRN